jgi:glutamyl-tRNA synthetase
MNPDGKGKLSKRTASKYGIPIAPLGYTDTDGTYVQGWKDLGYDPQAFINSLSLIGWNPGGDVEIMSMDELIANFSLAHVHKAGGRFDMDKAKFINSHYVKNISNADLMPFVTIKDDRFSDDKVNMIMDLAKARANFKHDLQHTVDLFYNTPVITDVKTLTSDFMSVMSYGDNHKNGGVDSFIVKCSTVNFDDVNDIKNMISSICDDLGIKMGKVMPGLRTALVGGVAGPDLMTTMSILGKQQTRIRIANALGAKQDYQFNLIKN